MSRADEIFIHNCKDILENGIWDTDRAVRTRWEDGTPAHTIKKFCIVNRYNLAEEFPILTIRRIYWKSVKQQGLPVTIKYPEMIAEIMPHFTDKTVYTKSNCLWFL